MRVRCFTPGLRSSQIHYPFHQCLFLSHLSIFTTTQTCRDMHYTGDGVFFGLRGPITFLTGGPVGGFETGGDSFFCRGIRGLAVPLRWWSTGIAVAMRGGTVGAAGCGVVCAVARPESAAASTTTTR